MTGFRSIWIPRTTTRWCGAGSILEIDDSDGEHVGTSGGDTLFWRAYPGSTLVANFRHNDPSIIAARKRRNNPTA